MGVVCLIVFLVLIIVVANHALSVSVAIRALRY